MKLVIVRHGDPNYDLDTLTERGWKEAELLAERLAKTEMTKIYVSPLGRAKDTASCTLKKTGRTEDAIFDWLQEFPVQVEFEQAEALRKGYPDARRREDGSYYSDIAWDMLPSYWTKRPEYFDRNGWRTSEQAKHSNIVACYDYVIEKFDALLAEHGYERCEDHYRVMHANKDTLVFFCHFGLECVLLSHLLGVSPYVLWHGTVFAPTSVTTIYTEEREKGIAYFRAGHIGDISHLTMAGVEPSFAARFCEIYDDFSERH